MDAGTVGRAQDDVGWGAAVVAALVAGLVFLVVQMVSALWAGMNAWDVPRMIAAIVLGQTVLPPALTSTAGVVLVALLVHFALSVGYGLILSALVFRLTGAGAALAGGFFGLVLYVVNFYGFTLLFPWFARSRNGVTFLNHIVFGLVAAIAYKLLSRRGEAEAPPVSATLRPV